MKVRMNIRTVIILLTQILFNSCTASANQEVENTFASKTKVDSLTKILKDLYTKISTKQSKKDISFSKFPPRFSEIKGLFSSYIHLNFQDEQNSFLAKVSRNELAALDMNMFVSNFVINSLLEALPYSPELQNEKSNELLHSVSLALDAILQFRDKNYKESVPVYNFWKQVNVNGTWSQSPETMVNLVKLAPHFSDTFFNFLHKIKMDNLANFIKIFEFECDVFQYVFTIPPDLDDSSVNMALTGLLYKLNLTNYQNKFITNENSKNFKNFGSENVGDLENIFKTKNLKYNSHHNIDLNSTLSNWFNNNRDYQYFFNTIKRKAYRPFINSNFSQFNSSGNNHSDLIDTRSYFVFRKFLEEKFSLQEEVILPTTWIFEWGDEAKFFPLISMPFKANNVDLNVATNFLFGLTNLIINHPDKNYISLIFDVEMQKIYSDTLDLVVFSLKNDILNWRPDLALLYYPSSFDFYWLISRVYSTLKNSEIEMKKLDENIYNLLNKTKLNLDDILKNEMTKTMFNKININPKDDNQFYFVEFLGNTDNYKRNEDSIFATALGLNSLLNIWTDETKAKLSYDENTPQLVQDVINKLANYLENNSKGLFTSYEGAFFSGSVKSTASSALIFPGNFYKFINGTDLNDHSTQPSDKDFSFVTLTIGMKGFVEEERYQQLLNETYFGAKPIQEFVPYNLNVFPYWSSSAMTMSINYLALAKYRTLIDQ